jgi:TonB family protein
MMPIAKRIFPFIVTLLLGLVLAGAFDLLRFAPCAKRKVAPLPSGTLSGLSCPSASRFDGTMPVRILFKPEPRYTSRAIANGTTGVVRLRAQFNADGTISDIEPLATLPDGLTEEAIRAARQIKFLPATENGRPVSVTKLIEYKFDLY